MEEFDTQVSIQQWCTLFLRDYFSFFQHASSDVERMILGNKCDMNEKRQVSKEKGEKVKFENSSYLEAYF